MNHNINYCRLCLQKTEITAETLSSDSKIFTLVTNLFPAMDTSIVINSMLCIECFKYIQFSNLMIESVTRNEQKLLLDLQNTQLLFEKATCRLCLNNDKLEGSVCLYKNTNEAARHVIEIAITNLDFDIFRKPVMCNSCWQIVKSIYLFKKKCFAAEKILKCYCASNKIKLLDRNELEMISLSYQKKLQQFSENLDKDDFLFDRNAGSIFNFNIPQNMLNNFTEHKNDVFEEVTYVPDALNIENDLLKEENEIEIKEEKLRDINESDDNVCMPADAGNLESIGRIQQIEITSNGSEILITKTEHVENMCHSQPGIDTKKRKKKLKMQLSADKGEEFLFCDKCNYQTKNKGSLKRHRVLHDDNAEQFNCYKCIYSTTIKRYLQSHMKRSHNIELLSLKCKECPFETRREVNFLAHLKTHRSKEKILKCSKCYYITAHRNLLKIHMEMHNKTKLGVFTCSICGYLAKRHTHLVSHMSVHQENYNFQCHKCSYQAKRKYHLVCHMLTHQENYNFKCVSCSYQAKRKSHLVSHMLNHQENYKYQCHTCSYETHWKPSLIAHMLKHQDSGKKVVFQCPYCKYNTIRMFRLTNHCEIVHDDRKEVDYNRTKIEIDTRSLEPKIKTSRCPGCSYRAKEPLLSRHVWTVHFPSNSATMKCYLCSFQCDQKDEFVVHVKCHRRGKNAAT